MSRPVIGICTALERARWGMWDQEAVLLSRSYVEAVQRAGALVLMLPPDKLLLERPQEALDLLDGLVIAGGADIDPASYGAEPHPETLDTVPERDRFEIALVRAAIERDLPVLGICRGMQLINVAYGGTLMQHLPERFGPWGTVYDRFRKWTRNGLWSKILQHLQVQCQADGQIDWHLFFIDGSVVRAHKAAAGARKKNTHRRAA